MSLLPATVLKLAPGVSVTYRTGIDVEIALGPERIVAGPHGVAILEAFRTPRPMGDAIAELGVHTTGMQEWIEMSAMVATFARLGILRDPSASAPALSPQSGRFDAANSHVWMLDDQTRTSAYQAAIRQTVRPGDVVVEVGTGTGVLAVTAAQAGAARVYAIEASAIADSARRVFEVNGVTDRVTVVEGLSSRVSLPERCDLLIAEIIGRDPLEESVLEFTRDAVTRFLKPGGRLVPSHFEVFTVPVAIPDEVRRRWTFTPEAVAEWRAAYNIDFSPLVDAARRSLWRISLSPKRLASFDMFTDPIQVLSRDLGALGSLSFTGTGQARVLRDGVVGGIALFFRATLAPGVVLHNDPREVRPDTSWDHLLWGLPEPVPVRVGATLEVTLRHRDAGLPVEMRCLPGQA
jgi:hypothetical protein